MSAQNPRQQGDAALPSPLDIERYALDPMSLDPALRDQCEQFIESNPAAADMANIINRIASRRMLEEAERRWSGQQTGLVPDDSLQAEPHVVYVRVPVPVKPWKPWLAVAAAVLIGVLIISGEKSASAKLTAQVASLKERLANLAAIFKGMGFPNPVRLDESPFQPEGRDRIRVFLVFDLRHVKSIEYRFSKSEQFRTLFLATERRPDEEALREVSVTSDPMPLTGDVIEAELRINTYDDAHDYIPERNRYYSRRFALSPIGISADPPQLSEQPVDRITNDKHPVERNRYTVTGRLPRDANTGELPTRSYLIIYPLLSDECWVSDVIGPGRDGRYFVKCYLGTVVDNERFLLKVISYYGSVKEEENPPAYSPNDRFSKMTDWSKKRFTVFEGSFKVNDGRDGFEGGDSAETNGAPSAPPFSGSYSDQVVLQAGDGARAPIEYPSGIFRSEESPREQFIEAKQLELNIPGAEQPEKFLGLLYNVTGSGTYNGFWLKLRDADWSAYKDGEIVLRLRRLDPGSDKFERSVNLGLPDTACATSFKLELKSKGKDERVSTIGLRQRISDAHKAEQKTKGYFDLRVPLSEFSLDLSRVQELVIVFENSALLPTECRGALAIRGIALTAAPGESVNELFTAK